MYNMYYTQKYVTAVICNSFEISPVVFMPNITTNHAITYTNLVHFVLCRKQRKKIRLRHHISRTEKCCESEDRLE